MRILLVTNTPWSRDLGAARVYVELAEEFVRLGHNVEKFSWEDAFPTPEEASPRAGRRISRLLSSTTKSQRFALRTRAFIRSQGHRFDIVDAGHTELPFPKTDLRLKGLLVARSVALTPAYARFEREAARRWPEPWSPRRLADQVLAYPRRRWHLQSWTRSLRCADLINVSNEEDHHELATRLGFGSKVVCFPFGLSEARAQAFRDERASIAERLAVRTVVFIGAWNSRKGARDWPVIVRQVRQQLSDTRFRFLGTDMAPHAVLRDFPQEDQTAIEVLTRFEGSHLPRLLSRVTVGAFPGYLEGFGFSVLEKLAAGLPVVAYDAPGPREMLQHQSFPTTVPVGDTEGFARRLIELLTLDAEQYGRHSADSTAIADRFRWRPIAQQTVAIYYERWRALGSSLSP